MIGIITLWSIWFTLLMWVVVIKCSQHYCPSSSFVSSLTDILGFALIRIIFPLYTVVAVVVSAVYKFM